MTTKKTFPGRFHDLAPHKLEIKCYRNHRSFFSERFGDSARKLPLIWRSFSLPKIWNQSYFVWDKVLYSSRGIRIRCYTVPTASRIKKVLKLIVTGHLFGPYGPNKGG